MLTAVKSILNVSKHWLGQLPNLCEIPWLGLRPSGLDAFDEMNLDDNDSDFVTNSSIIEVSKNKFDRQNGSQSLDLDPENPNLSSYIYSNVASIFFYVCKLSFVDMCEIWWILIEYLNFLRFLSEVNASAILCIKN